MAFIGDENAPLRDDRIAQEKKKLQALAAELKPGLERDTILQKISQLDTTARINEWISSPGLRAPR